MSAGRAAAAEASEVCAANSPPPFSVLFLSAVSECLPHVGEWPASLQRCSSALGFTPSALLKPFS